MKSCVGCKHAKWDTTKVGKLHPSGAGKCTFEVKIPQLPVSKYWEWVKNPEVRGENLYMYYDSENILAIRGGAISRRRIHEVHCPYYQHL